jgi:signal transduction histidine kinase
MTPDVAAQIFEPLYSTKAFGVGLGMPLVKRILEEHGGKVKVDTAAGQGTRVTLQLPLGS